MLEDPNLIVRYFDRNNFERDAEIVRELLYDTFHNHWGYYPAEPEEWCIILKSYLPHIPEELFLIIEDYGEPVAFTFSFNDSNKDNHAQRLGYKSTNKRQKLDMIGVRANYRRHGFGTYINYCMIEGLKANEAKELCCSWVLEDNHKSLGLCKSNGFSLDTKYRVYQKKFE